MEISLETYCACRVALARCKLLDIKAGIDTAKLDQAYLDLKRAMKDEIEQALQSV